MSTTSIRPARAGDLPFIRTMLYEAAFWRPDTERPTMDEALRRPELAVYLDGWGRPGDQGLIAHAAEQPTGAVWVRCFDDRSHGYGYIDQHTPELTIAVHPRHRRQGIARALLLAMLTHLGRAGVAAVSLSVEDENPARLLYEQQGFSVHARSAAATTMIRRVDAHRA
jgi:ribosomal protein S18 acetylase RimI-like enzyme